MLTLICGRGRAGKTTYSRAFENVIHLDTVARSGRDRYPAVLRMVSEATGDVVVEGIYDTAERRRALVGAYAGEGARCVWLDTPAEVIASRMCKWIGHRTPPVIPREFEPPTYDEGWDEIEVIRP